ncbi:MAG TPA: DUF222 domain-containing protein [Galbitalea sp.]|jgi:hypothetical protein|nr:DUF222 domain-containing protein [Galbitalea sp.]
MTPILDTLQQAFDLLSAVARVDRATLSDVDLVAVLAAEENVRRLLDASQVLTAGDVADRSRYELGAEGLSMRYSQRKPIDFIEQTTRISKAEASRRVRIGLAIRPRQSMLGETLPPARPIVAEAMTNGLLGMDTTATILYSLKQAAGGSEATPENMDAAELALVKLGTTDSADMVADIGRVWRDALDPDGIEPRYEEIRERRGVFIGRERNGIKDHNIKADPEMSAVLDAIFIDSMDPNVGPRFMSEEDRARGLTLVEDDNGELVETIVDPRSIEQKRIDILKGVLIAGLRATREGPANLRTIGSVTAVVSLKDLQSGTGFGILEGTDEVIPASAIQEIACDSGFQLVVLGSKGEPLYHGRLQRYFTPAQRRAMIARDGDRCIALGCKKRGASSHAHHVILYSDGGPTDLNNGVLLCPAHHHALHQGAFEIKMVDGMPWIRLSVDSHDDTAWKPASRNRLLIAAA